jgi:hypothetical protein
VSAVQSDDRESSLSECGRYRLEGAVAVAKHITWRFVPRKGVSYLPSDPLGSRIVRHANAHQPPAGVTHDYQAIEQLERDRGYDEKIQRGDPGGMIVQESLPTLRWWSAVPNEAALDCCQSRANSSGERSANALWGRTWL